MGNREPRSHRRQRTDSALIRVSSPVYKAVLETSERLITYMQAVNLVPGEYLPN